MTTPKILSRARQDIVNMPPYTSARSLVQATDDFVFLDAGECPFPPYEDAPAQNYGRYPDKQPDELLTVLSRLYDVPKDRIIVTRGEDEAIDILVRTFCAPKEDKLMVCPPTFPMYAMSAAIHGAGGQYVPLTEDDFALDVDGVSKFKSWNINGPYTSKICF